MSLQRALSSTTRFSLVLLSCAEGLVFLASIFLFIKPVPSRQKMKKAYLSCKRGCARTRTQKINVWTAFHQASAADWSRHSIEHFRARRKGGQRRLMLLPKDATVCRWSSALLLVDFSLFACNSLFTFGLSKMLVVALFVFRAAIGQIFWRQGK